MKATPVIPGIAYRVTGSGVDQIVSAGNPVDAVIRGICCALAARSL
jgi:hypothetical protein